jgi:hypothetical protein
MDAMVPGLNPLDIIKVDLGDRFKALFDLKDMKKVLQHKWTLFRS